MAARPGVIGEADGSTLFLDEIGELPASLQAHLLRVLDGGGEYQRLGDAQVRRSDFMLIAATNADPAELKHDLLARITHRVTLPSLRDRREDVPLLVRHLLGRIAATNPQVERRFFERHSDGSSSARLHPELVEALVCHRYSHNVRELDTLLWQAIGGSNGIYVALTPEVEAAIVRDEPAAPRADVGDVTAEEIRACLERCGWNVSRAWQELGLRSRYALYRLMKKYDIAI